MTVKVTKKSFPAPRVSTHLEKVLNRDGNPEPFDTAQLCIMDAAPEPALTITPGTFIPQKPQYNPVNECWYLWLDIPPGVIPPAYVIEFNPRGFKQKELRQRLHFANQTKVIE